MAETCLRAELRDWLARWHLEQYAGVLEQHDVLDVELVQLLTEGDLTEMGITKVGARRRFLNAIEQERRMSGMSEDAFGGLKVVEADLGQLSLPHTWKEGLRGATTLGRQQTAETQGSVTEPSYGPSAESSLFTTREKATSWFATPQPGKMGMEPEVRPGSALLAAGSKRAMWVQETQAMGKPSFSTFTEERRSSGMDDATAALITDTMVNASQAIGLFRGSTPLIKAGPEEKDSDPKHRATISQQYIDAQQRFMEMAKDRAHTQERFLTEAEHMKGMGALESSDFVGTVRKFLSQSPLLVKKEENLRGRSSSRQRASVWLPSGDALDMQFAASKSNPASLRKNLSLSPARHPGALPPMRPMLPSKSTWQKLLEDQEQMHNTINVQDEAYKKLMERLVESEKDAFSRLIGSDAVHELATCFEGPSSLRRAAPRTVH
eukprot:GGOE01025304.1.p1 GENE.GGOE01025304.1~~GGOE01025304.1.p1  ORF type:complete len:436 (+),score=132.18 GGOE01025304.1:86-1393(+)